MEELLKKANINQTRARQILVRASAENLSGLSEPCFKPELKKHYYELLRLSNLTEKDIREFTKERWKGRKEAKFLIQSEPIANFYIFLMYYFLKKRDMIGFRSTMLFYVIRHYRALLEKYLPKYCDPETFKYALDIMTRTHLFVREKTIGNAMYHIANEMIRRYQKYILEDDLDMISKFMQECRHRVEQSVKSFASAYYRAAKEGEKIKTQPESSEEEGKIVQVIKKESKPIIDTVKRITIYKQIDKDAQEEARRITKVNHTLATKITGALADTNYTDNIKLILNLFVKDMKDVKQLCGKDFYQYVKSLMSVKRTTTQIYFKQQINILIEDVLKKIRLKKQYDKFTPQTKFLINSFLAYYLTISLKNSVC